MKIMKNLQKKRTSKRTYPTRICIKPDCTSEFVPTDSRQVYCSKQHRIDTHNDKRKIVDKFENEFRTKAKNNKIILMKIFCCEEYNLNGYINHSILKYEGYDFSIFHIKKFEIKSNREIAFCYNYGLLLIDSENKNYKIYIV